MALHRAQISCTTVWDSWTCEAVAHPAYFVDPVVKNYRVIAFNNGRSYLYLKRLEIYSQVIGFEVKCPTSNRNTYKSNFFIVSRPTSTNYR